MVLLITHVDILYATCFGRCAHTSPIRVSDRDLGSFEQGQQLQADDLADGTHLVYPVKSTTLSDTLPCTACSGVCVVESNVNAAHTRAHTHARAHLPSEGANPSPVSIHAELHGGNYQTQCHPNTPIIKISWRDEAFSGRN